MTDLMPNQELLQGVEHVTEPTHSHVFLSSGLKW